MNPEQYAYPMAFTQLLPEQKGMTLRDWFAGQALATCCYHNEDGCIRYADDAARMAYEFADAMLAERNK